MFENRSFETEQIDKGESFYTPEEYQGALEQLGRVGILLGGNRAIKSGFKGRTPTSILDIGCGGGFIAKLLSTWYPEATVTGIDMNPNAIAFAMDRHKPLPKNLRFEYREHKGVIEGEKSFDVVTATLVLHHMDDEDLIEFLRESRKVARQCVILNDLHRHWLAYWFYFFVSKPLFRNRLITEDGLLSIRKSFVRKELENYLKAAAIPKEQYKLQWVFPFRWIVTIQAAT